MSRFPWKLENGGKKTPGWEDFSFGENFKLKKARGYNLWLEGMCNV